MNYSEENKELSEFDRYVVSPVIDDGPDEKQSALGIALGISYLFFLGSIVYMIMALFIPNLSDVNYDNSLEETIAQLISGVIVVGLTIYIIKFEKFKKILKGFKLKNLIIAIVFFYLTNVALNLVVELEALMFGKRELISSNQKELIEMMKNYKALSFIFIVVFAPIVEEIIFRYFIFNGSKKKYGVIPAFLITVITFVAIHYIQSIVDGKLLEDLKCVLEYVVPSFALTFLYYKNKNLATPIIFHMIFNGIQWLNIINSRLVEEGTNSVSSLIQCIFGG